MKICVDENIPLVTVSELKKLQHDVLDIRQSPAQGISDELLWDLATKERRLFITTDKGFAQHRNETPWDINRAVASAKREKDS